MNKKLYRDEYHRMIGGVCAGMAEYFEMDVTVLRLLFAFSFIIMGVGFIPYIVLWIVLPKKGYVFNNFNNPTVDYTVPPQQSGEPFNTPHAEPGNPFGGNPFGGNPFVNNPPQNKPAKQKSNAALIVGVVLIILGGAILIDEFDIIPDFDFSRLWPVILVIVGGILIVNGRTTHPSEIPGWEKTGKKDDTQTAGGTSTDHTSTVEE